MNLRQYILRLRDEECMTLAEIKLRLEQFGVDVHMSTLSRWANGDAQPRQRHQEIFDTFYSPDAEAADFGTIRDVDISEGPKFESELTDDQRRILKIFGHLKGEELKLATKSAMAAIDPGIKRREWKTNKFSIGIFSDTHIGEKHFRADWLYDMYRYFDLHPVDWIYHAGDILEGMSGRPGHIYELTHPGFDAQVEYAVSLLKDCPFPIRAITGNHDLWYYTKGNMGADPGFALQSELGEDRFAYMGKELADEIVGTVKVRLFHPRDGSAYSHSYKIQRHIEGLRGGDKPHILVMGHYHKQIHCQLRNIQGIMPGTLCEQTDFMRGSALGAATGFYRAEVEMDENGLVSFNPTWVPFMT